MTITTTITNNSRTVCEGTGVEPDFRILDAAGTLVFECRPAMVEALAGGTPWSPGQSYSGECQWSQMVGNSPAPAGTYTAQVQWESVPGLAAMSKSFTIS